MFNTGNLHFLAWEFLPFVSTAKYFQRFKILRYYQNTACISFYILFTHIYRFSIDFYGRNNVFKVWISFSSLSKSFCVDPLGAQSLCALISWYVTRNKLTSYFSLCFFDKEKIGVKLLFRLSVFYFCIFVFLTLQNVHSFTG